MKFIMVLTSALLLSGCSVSYSRNYTPPAPTQMDMGKFSQKVHFIELIELVRDNGHKAPTPELKKKAERLLFEAGLNKKCANNICWLTYQDLKITTDEMFINIEYRDKSMIKIDINEPQKAAKVIYG